jgi:hypothetical protein
MSPPRPLRVTALRGRITQGLYGKGTKSERKALFFKTADNRYVFRRKRGPAFGDTELKKYIGRDVECDGFLIGSTLLAERIEIVE